MKHLLAKTWLIPAVLFASFVLGIIMCLLPAAPNGLGVILAGLPVAAIFWRVGGGQHHVDSASD